MNVTLGKQAPDFTADAFDQGGTRKVRLADYRGRWVMLFFYPAAFSTV
jgi:peroxiredoxin (alkyl hydroperoxide reductase subunit C)